MEWIKNDQDWVATTIDWNGKYPDSVVVYLWGTFKLLEKDHFYLKWESSSSKKRM